MIASITNQAAVYRAHIDSLLRYHVFGIAIPVITQSRVLTILKSKPFEKNVGKVENTDTNLLIMYRSVVDMLQATCNISLNTHVKNR